MGLKWLATIKKSVERLTSNEDKWHDSPETFAVREVCSKSNFSQVNLLATIPIGICAFFIFCVLIRFVRLIFHIPPITGVSLIVWIIFGWLVGLCASFCYLLKLRYNFIQQNRRIQWFVNNTGTNSLGILLELFTEICRERGKMWGEVYLNSIGERVTLNIKYVLDHIDSNSVPPLTANQLAILCTMLDIENERDRVNRTTFRQKFQQHSIALTSSIITALACFPCDESEKALIKRYNKTQSYYIFNLIYTVLNQIENQKYPLEKRLSIRSFNDVRNIDQTQNVSRNVDSDKMRTRLTATKLFRFFIVIILILFIVDSFLKLPTGMQLSIIFFQLFFFGSMRLKSFWNHNTLILDTNDDSPELLNDLLSNFRTKLGIFPPDTTFVISVAEICTRIDIDNTPKLSGDALSKLHSLVMPREKWFLHHSYAEMNTPSSPLYTILQGLVRLKSALITPFYSLVFRLDPKNPFPQVDYIKSIIMAIGILGNSSSVRFLEQFRSETTDPDLAVAAQESISVLKARMAVTPQELLRASSVPADGLLQPAAQEGEAVLLRAALTEEASDQLRLGG